MALHVAVVHPCTDIVGNHVCGYHLRRREQNDVCAISIYGHHVSMPVRSVKVEAIAQADQIPPHMVALAHGHHRHIAVKITIDSQTNVRGNETAPDNGKIAICIAWASVELLHCFGLSGVGLDIVVEVPAIVFVNQEVGGDIDNFVRDRLKYPTKAALCKVLSAEQIDAVAMAIYNIEARSQGTIVGDQTGIGKGRIAAAMIRYGVMQGNTPIFITEKANLFSDIYRDLNAIGSGHLKPFIVNSKEGKTDIKDEDGNVVYEAPPLAEQQNIFESRHVPSKYDFVVATYSQFNSAERKPVKPNFLLSIAYDNILIMDEAHNSSGAGNTGRCLTSLKRFGG